MRTQLEYDDALERAIDEVGRDRVFARAQSYGWTAAMPPPKYVWSAIVNELREEHEQRRQPQERPITHHYHEDIQPKGVLGRLLGGWF